MGTGKSLKWEIRTGGWEGIAPAGRERPRVLVVMYGNPNYHPPTLNAVRIMSERFSVNMVCRNDAGPAAHWPPAVAIERVGELVTSDQSFGAGIWRTLSCYRTFVRPRCGTIARNPSALL